MTDAVHKITSHKRYLYYIGFAVECNPDLESLLNVYSFKYCGKVLFLPQYTVMYQKMAVFFSKILSFQWLFHRKSCDIMTPTDEKEEDYANGRVKH